MKRENKIKSTVNDLDMIYVRNMKSIFNHKEPIEHMVKVELFYKEYKERTEIDVIRG